METLKIVIGSKYFARVAVAVLMSAGLFLAYSHVSATVPSDRELSAEMLPDVVREIEKTQEYADRNATAKLCEKAIDACQKGDCQAWIDSQECTGF